MLVVEWASARSPGAGAQWASARSLGAGNLVRGVRVARPSQVLNSFTLFPFSMPQEIRNCPVCVRQAFVTQTCVCPLATLVEGLGVALASVSACRVGVWVKGIPHRVSAGISSLSLRSKVAWPTDATVAGRRVGMCSLAQQSSHYGVVLCAIGKAATSETKSFGTIAISAV